MTSDVEEMFPERAGWVDWLVVSKGLSPTTINVYTRELEALANAGLGPVATLGPDALRDYVHKRGGASATVARRLAAIGSFYRYLVRTDARPDDPTTKLDRPKLRRGLPRPVPNVEAAIAKLDDPTAQLVAVFLYETGLRISEACSIREDSPIPDVLRVRGKGSKDRLVLLRPRARAALEWLGGRMPYGPRSIQRRFREAGFTPHQMRHTFGCELAADGADLGEMQDLLGHESPATTRVYAQYALPRLWKALNRRDSRRPDSGRP